MSKNRLYKEFPVKKILLTLLCGFTLFAGEITWYKDYAQAQKVALQSNKILLVLVTTDVCPWCNKLKKETLKDPSIIAKITDKFVALELNRDRDTYPEAFRTRMVPTTFFADKIGKPLMRPALGYHDVETYDSYLNDAIRKAASLPH